MVYSSHFLSRIVITVEFHFEATEARLVSCLMKGVVIVSQCNLYAGIHSSFIAA